MALFSKATPDDAAPEEPDTGSLPREISDDEYQALRARRATLLPHELDMMADYERRHNLRK